MAENNVTRLLDDRIADIDSQIETHQVWMDASMEKAEQYKVAAEKRATTIKRLRDERAEFAHARSLIEQDGK